MSKPSFHIPPRLASRRSTLPVRRPFILQLAIDVLAFIACLIAGLALILSIPLAMVLMLLGAF